jgi:hypothetical protein
VTNFGRVRAIAARGPSYVSLISARASARVGSKPVLAVLSGIGDDNFGDEWMYEALRQGLPKCRLAPLELPMTERRLAGVGLSGSKFFAGLIVGGGTLVNSYFLDRARPMLEKDSPAWMLGTGVGSAGFGVAEGAADPASWAPYLPRFRRVAVRGPLSAQRLEPVEAEVLGDLALFHTPDAPEVVAGRRTLLVNVSGTEAESNGGGLSDAHVATSAAAIVNMYRQDGWTCVPLIVHRDDAPRLVALGALVGGWDAPLVHVRTGADATRAMASAGALVANRLHATALGWMFGVPTVALAYRDKTLDLAALLGANEGVIDLRTDDLADVVDVTRLVMTSAGARERAIHARALEARERIRLLLSSVEADVLARRAGSSVGPVSYRGTQQ